MRAYFDWLVRHEKLVMGVTLILVIALVVQLKLRSRRVEPGAGLPQKQTPATLFQKPSSSTINVAGDWEMSVLKRSGGRQIWALTLEQNGELLKGIINSEGGDLTVSGTIKGQEIYLSAQRFGLTVEFPATLEGDVMMGTMRALAVTRQWTARRKR